MNKLFLYIFIAMYGLNIIAMQPQQEKKYNEKASKELLTLMRTQRRNEYTKDLNSFQEDIKNWLSKGADPNVKDRADGPLLCTDMANDMEFSRFLMEQGADPNILSGTKKSPLHKAAAWGNVALIKEYIGRGVYMHSKDDLEYTPLMAAVVASKRDAVSALLSGGATADLTEKDYSGATPSSYLIQLITLSTSERPLITRTEDEIEEARQILALLLQEKIVRLRQINAEEYDRAHATPKLQDHYLIL